MTKPKKRVRKPRSLGPHISGITEDCVCWHRPDGNHEFTISTESNKIEWAIRVRNWLNRFIAWAEQERKRGK